MKNTENNKKLYRHYLDDLYTTEDDKRTFITGNICCAHIAF